MSSAKNILVILDLDETLIHATKNPPHTGWEHEIFGYKLFRRPYLDEFLQELKNDFQVAVWSSASDDYVAEVVRFIFPQDYPLVFVWGRSRCTYKPDYRQAEELGYFDYFNHYDYVKRLDKLRGRFPFPKEKILIVDDTPKKCIHNYGNAIYPQEFTGDKNDDELKRLSAYLKTLKDVDNVRTIEKRFWRNS